MGKGRATTAALLGLLLLFLGCVPCPPQEPRLVDDFAGLTGSLRLEFATSQGRQVAYYLEPPATPGQPPTRLAILYPGIGSVALGWLRFIDRAAAPDTGWLLLDYPGRGDCEGALDPADLYRSSEGALAALAVHYGVARLEAELALLGHSFGSGAAMQFAARRPVRRIVLVAPFDTLRRAAALKSWFLALIMPRQIDNLALTAGLLQAPDPPAITVFHGTSDKILPVEMGRNIRAAAPERIDYREFPGDGHIDILFTRRAEIIGALTSRE